MYDIIIVGGGPAGIAAAIYAKRAGRDVAVIEKFIPGGQVALTGQIENYPGFAKIEGSELADKFKTHAQALGVPFIMDEVTEFDLDKDIKTVICKNGSYSALSVILAMGCHSKELNIDGELRLKGKGVSYCAICDGNFFKGKDVAVVGSGDSAFSDAIYLSSICNKVYILAKSKLKLNNYSENEFDGSEKVTILKNALSTSIEGNDRVEKLHFNQDGEEHSIDVSGVFVAIGRSPETSQLTGKINLSERGYVIANDKMMTNCAGVFACGDIREGSLRQIATAVGDGAIAGTEASKYVLVYKAQHK